MRAFGLSDAGPVRRGNEDAFVCDEALGLFLVADGMGGHRAGEVASRLAIEAVHNFIRHTEDSTEFTWPCGIDRDLSLAGNRLRTGVFLANRRVFRAAETHDDYVGMGSTIAGVLLAPDRVALAHVGDSRVYQLTDGGLTCLTQDDSWSASILRGPGVDPGALASHPMRHVLTNVLGARETTDIHAAEVPRAGVQALLLCSDGLHTVVDDAQLAVLMRGPGGPEAIAQALVAKALQAGSRDNVTALVVWCDDRD